MSNYITYARPKGMAEGQQQFLRVTMLDNYFGRRRYGVKFPNGFILEEHQCEFKDNGGN